MQSKFRRFLSYTIWRIKLLFKKDKKLYLLFYYSLGLMPNQLSLYRLALHHKTMPLNKTKKNRGLNNERLEFLGDAVLNMAVGELVYRYLRHAEEGKLTDTRTKLVRRDYLNAVANEMGLNKLLKAKYNKREVYRPKNTVGNSLEALVGAIYLDRGYRACYRFIEERIVKGEDNLKAISKQETNFKSRLLEWCQKHKVYLFYDQIEQSEDMFHNSVFIIEVFLDNVSYGTGKGCTKKEAEQQAAQVAYEKVISQSKRPASDPPQSDRPVQTHTSASQPHP